MRNLPLVLFSALVLASCTEPSRPEAHNTTSTAPARTLATATRPPAAATPRVAPRPPTGTARQAQPFDPTAFTVELEPVARGFAQPVFVTHAGDGSGRLFVVEQSGRIRIIEGNAVRQEPFLDIRALVVAGGEQGLLGLAFHPRYRENGRFFVMYTARNGDNTVAEYRVSSDPNRADPSSGRVLLAIPDFASNHNGGMVAFGPDGYLYVGTGDGGGAGDPRRYGQNRDSLLGKLLRLDVDAGDPYGIPPSNPFVTGGGRPEVWAYGLRNPWRFSFDRATGDLWIGDVGQNAWEEINFQPAGSGGGANYGWNIMEGAHCFRAQSCDTTGLTLPVAEYALGGGNCAITGGYVYRGVAFPVLTGAYYFADYCSGRLWALAQDAAGTWQRTELTRLDLRISSFGEDEAGELYVCGHNTGVIYRLKAVGR